MLFFGFVIWKTIQLKLTTPDLIRQVETLAESFNGDCKTIVGDDLENYNLIHAVGRASYDTTLCSCDLG